MQNWTLITGASEGLGVEFAHIAAAEGRNLILTARSQDKLDALAEELLRGADIKVKIIPADLSDITQAEALWAQASALGHIDILVNNAGLGRHGVYGDGQGWDREHATIAVNITALSYLMKQAIPHMAAAGGGRIMNLASTAGFMPGPNMAVYHASKAYVLSLSEAVAEELRASNVTLTAICPGATQTAFFEAAGMGGITLLKLTKPASAQAVAKAAWQATLAGRRVLVTGVHNKLFALLPRFFPRRVVSFVAGKVMGRGW